MARFGGIPNTRQFRELIREEALPLPRLAKAPTLPIAPTLPMDMTKFPTSPVAPIAPVAVAQSAIDNLPVNMGAISSPTLGNLGTSGISVLEEISMPDSVSPIAESGISEMDTDIDKEIEKILAAAMAPPSQETVNADIAKLMGMEPQVSVETVDPVTAAVEAAVGNGQPTTDNAILNENDMPIGAMVVTPYYNPATGETFDQTNTAMPVPEGFIPVPEGGIPTTTETQQPDFMTQLNDLIAQMQLEQTAVAEQQQQQEQQRQEQTAEMTKNYMIGQPAVGYNPYQSGQYQNNPYGAAGVPNMGGITSIPVPAPYQAPRTMT